MGQPSTIYKPGKLNYVWNYLSSTLDNFRTKLLGYRSYVAMINQSDTDDPTAMVFQNNIGTITLRYESKGVYSLNFDSNIITFTNSIGFVNITNDAVDTVRFCWVEYSGPNQIFLRVFDETYSPVDDNKIYLEFRVYN